MPDDRFFHKRLGHSAKVNILTDFEFRVWTQYQLSADDCGVLREAAIAIQADNDSLAARSTKLVQRALAELVNIGLLLRFTHQEQSFLCQRVGRISSVFVTQRPQFTPVRRRLFSTNVGNAQTFSHTSPQHFGKVSAIFGNISKSFRNPRARGANGRQQWLTAMAQAWASAELADQAGRFVEHYGELFAAPLQERALPQQTEVDFQEALGCVDLDDAALEQLAIAFLTTDEKFCRNGNGSIAHFRSRASWCDARLKRAG